MDAFCMYISCLFSSGTKLGVRKFRDFIEFGFQDSRIFSSILLCCLSKVWVENLHIKDGIENLMAVMTS